MTSSIVIRTLLCFFLRVSRISVIMLTLSRLWFSPFNPTPNPATERLKPFFKTSEIFLQESKSRIAKSESKSCVEFKSTTIQSFSFKSSFSIKVIKTVFPHPLIPSIKYALLTGFDERNVPKISSAYSYLETISFGDFPNESVKGLFKAITSHLLHNSS